MHKLFFGDGVFLEVVFFFIFGKPFGKFIVVFEGEASVGVLNNLFFGGVPEHFFGDGKGFG